MFKIKEKPLIAMEVSIIGERYLNWGHSENAFMIFNKLKEKCRIFNGQFVLLWQNNHLVDMADKELYLSIIKK